MFRLSRSLSISTTAPRAVKLWSGYGLLGISSIVFSILALSVTTGNFLVGDDIFRARLPIFAHVHQLSTLPALQAIHNQIASEQGAFAPLRAGAFTLWIIPVSIPLLRWLQIALVTLNFTTLTIFAAYLGRSARIGWLTLAALLIGFQLHSYYDPILTEIGGQPALAEWILISLAAGWIAQERSSWRWSLLSALSFFIAALISPYAWPVGIALAALWLRSRNLPLTIATLTIPIALSCVSALRKEPLHCAHVRNIGEYLSYFSVQLIGTLPLAYRTAGNVDAGIIGSALQDTRYLSWPQMTMGAWFTAAAIAIMVGIGLSTRKARSESYADAMLVGWLLWLAPAILGVTEPIWSGHLILGNIFPSAYLSSFGLALLIAIFGARGIDAIKNADWRFSSALTCALLSFLISLGNFRSNAFVVRAVALRYENEATLNSASDAGFFNNLPKSATLIYPSTDPLTENAQGYRDPRLPYLLYVSHAETIASIQDHGRLCANANEAICAPLDHRAPVWVLSFNARSPILESPQLTLAHWVNTTTENEVESNIAFTFHHYGSAEEKFAAQSALGVFREGAYIKILPTPAHSTNVVSSVIRTCGVVEQSQMVSPDSVHLEWGNGFYPLEPSQRVIITGAVPLYGQVGYRRVDQNVLWRFGRTNATLFLLRDRCRRASLRLNLMAWSSAPGDMIVTFDGQREQRHIDNSGTLVSFKVSTKLGDRIPVSFITNADPATEELGAPFSAQSFPLDARILVGPPGDRPMVSKD